MLKIVDLWAPLSISLHLNSELMGYVDNFIRMMLDRKNYSLKINLIYSSVLLFGITRQGVIHEDLVQEGASNKDVSLKQDSYIEKSKRTNFQKSTYSMTEIRSKMLF